MLTSADADRLRVGLVDVLRGHDRRPGNRFTLGEL
jgi:hypothetical protein